MASLELPLKDDLNDSPTVTEYKAAIGALYDFVDSGFLDPVVGGGAADVQTAALGETGYKTNRIYCAIPGFTNTGPCTYNFDGIGAKNVKLISGSDPYAGAITVDVPAYFRYDATNLVLLNPYFNLDTAKLTIACKFVTGSFSTGSVASGAVSSVQSITHGLGTDDVILQATVIPTNTGVPESWAINWFGPSRRSGKIFGGGASGLASDTRTPPATGIIDIYVYNTSGTGRTYTVNYKISALA